MAYVRKTIDEYDIEGNYGHGFEVVTAENNLEDAKMQYKLYCENEPEFSFRIKKRRVKKDN